MNLLHHTVQLARYVAAAALFGFAALVAGGVLFFILIGFYSFGIPFFAIAGVVVTAAVWLGLLCLPSSEPGRHRAGMPASAEPDEVLYGDHERDELNERLGEQLALPSRRPTHDFHVRQAVPPLEGDHV